jgi:hypothetical protein
MFLKWHDFLWVLWFSLSNIIPPWVTILTYHLQFRYVLSPHQHEQQRFLVTLDCLLFRLCLQYFRGCSWFQMKKNEDLLCETWGSHSNDCYAVWHYRGAHWPYQHSDSVSTELHRATSQKAIIFKDLSCLTLWSQSSRK